jgi:hypothetical protein
MKKQPLIFLPILIDSCAVETSSQLNTGTIKECLEGLTTKLYIAHASQRFATLAEFKDMTAWEAAITDKSVVPLFNVYEVASANTDAVIYETGNFVYTTKKEIKKMTSESYLSLCSHRALKSFENSEYTQIYEVTEAGEILGVFDTDGVKIKGQDITNFDVAIRERPTNDKPAYSMVTITFRDFDELEDNGVIVKTTWDPNMLNGIFQLQLQVITQTATEITFKAVASCGANNYNTLTDADMLLLDAAGEAQVISAMTNLNNVYTITGVALVSGTLGTAGVIETGDTLVEASDVPIIIV